MGVQVRAAQLAERSLAVAQEEEVALGVGDPLAPRPLEDVAVGHVGVEVAVEVEVGESDTEAQEVEGGGAEAARRTDVLELQPPGAAAAVAEEAVELDVEVGAREGVR